MKRGLLLLLVVIAVAGYLGTLIARDPGYVLLAYDGYSMQTSLWVLVGLFLGFFLAATGRLFALALFLNAGLMSCYHFSLSEYF